MVAFWGESYRNRFATLLLPSLLAPANLPLLRAEDGHRFLIATTRDDWDIASKLPMIAALRRHVHPVHVEIPEGKDSGYAAALHRQTRCLKLLFQTAYPSRPYGCLLLPDLIVSDGFVAALLRAAASGERLMVLPALRQVEESVLGELTATGLMSTAGRQPEMAQPITLSPRTVASLALRHLHPEVAIFEEGHPLQPLYPPFRFWRVPNRDGIILHGFFGLPILMDFAAMPADHADCLDDYDYETIYLGRNFPDGAPSVITDSDECGILSLAEKSLDRSTPRLSERFGLGLTPQYALLANLRQNIARYCRPHRDLVRRDLFRRTVFWHADDLDDAYRRKEDQIQNLIERAAGDYYASGTRLPATISANPRYFMLDLAAVPQSLMRMAGLVRILIAAAAGDSTKAAKLRQVVSALIARYRALLFR